MATPYLRLGARGSPLSLAQARETRALIAKTLEHPEDAIEIVEIRTTGDSIIDRSLSEAGGKGLFTRELDAALAAGTIDLAVHSAKDLPTILPPEIAIAGYLPREDARDALICASVKRFADLPHRARMGSASLRRQAMALRLRPNLQLSLLRGNVETRIAKVESGEFDFTLLALAGLKRLGLAHRAAAILEEDEFVPAVGQGALAVTTLVSAERLARSLAPIFDAATGHALAAERAFLTVLDGSCRTPIGAHARIVAGRIAFRGILLSPDGALHSELMREGELALAAEIGQEAAREILATAPPGLVRA
jgi:hydroxymethylbilane synthase